MALESAVANLNEKLKVVSWLKPKAELNDSTGTVVVFSHKKI